MTQAEQNNKLLTDSTEELHEFLESNMQKYLKLLERELHVEISFVDDKLSIRGEMKQNEIAKNVLQHIRELQDAGITPQGDDILNSISMVKQGSQSDIMKLYQTPFTKTFHGKPIFPKNKNQQSYISGIDTHPVTFGVGPAGTGKSFLAVAQAVKYLQKRQVDKIILTRPAVEAGENLGFLPGDLKEKVDPYLRPLYDSLETLIGPEHLTRLMDQGKIEIAPLAYMRGRTLDNAFIILDEAQNTTTMQMKMFLTRLGFGSKMVVNGDLSQIDLKNNMQSGLVQATEYLADIPDIKTVLFNAGDVVRNPVVSKIVAAYEQKSENDNVRHSNN